MCTILLTLLHHCTSLPRRAFHWDAHCQQAFDSLKMALTQAPILAFPEFRSSAPPFSLQTDASAVGVGAVLEQDGHVIAYASQSLTPAERNYSVIQRECLAVVYGIIDILYWDWNLRIHRVPMYVNLPVIKWQPFPATCGANGFSVAPCLLYIDGFGCCALHGANRICGNVWYEHSGVRYCLSLLSCALWLSRRKRRSSRGIAHDDSAQTRC